MPRMKRSLQPFVAVTAVLALAWTLTACVSWRSGPREAEGGAPAAAEGGAPGQAEQAARGGGAGARGQRQEGPRPYADVVTEEARSDAGVFTVHWVGEDLLLEIPDSLLGRDMLLISRMASVPVGFPGFSPAGVKTGDQVIRWERRGDLLQFRQISFGQVAPDSLPISISVAKNNFYPIVAAFDIEARGPDDASSVIDVTDFFEGDTPAIAGLSSQQRSQYQVRRLDPNRSFINYARSYPLNVEVRHTQTFEAGSPPGGGNSGALSLEMNQSLILLPEEPMRPRYADSRVGWFSITQVNYGLDVQKAGEQTFIRRWRLEPSDPEAYARGELVDPVEPITYYIDPATPARWRPYVRQGVLDWQAAFESAGFSNAIVALDPPSPEEDPEWSPEDVRYSVVRWAASLTRNAQGPSTSDPRTGEIIESDIVWYHNHMRSYRNRLMIETGAANPQARSLDIPEELMGETMRQVIAHEIGHALGLPHNWIASAAFPVDSLRSPSFTSEYGVAASIMEYARQNYIAQPGDGVTRFVRKIGPYDHYAINWGYRMIPDARTPEDEKATLDRWILEKADDPMYRFGPTGDASYSPEIQTEDLGDDPVKASGYGIANLKRVLPNLPAWTATPGEDYADLEEIYGEFVGMWSRYIGHVQAVPGGVLVDWKATDQDGPVYRPVPGSRQRAAVRFLIREVFQDAEWLNDPAVLSKIEASGAIDRVRSAQVRTLNSLLQEGRMERMAEAALTDPGTAYPVTQFMADLKGGVWGEIADGRAIDTYRRGLQRAYLDRLEAIVSPPAEEGTGPGGGGSGGSTDLRALARAQLEEIRDEAEAAVGRAPDALTRYHLRDVVARVEGILGG